MSESGPPELIQRRWGGSVEVRVTDNPTLPEARDTDPGVPADLDARRAWVPMAPGAAMEDRALKFKNTSVETLMDPLPILATVDQGMDQLREHFLRTGADVAIVIDARGRPKGVVKVVDLLLQGGRNCGQALLVSQLGVLAVPVTCTVCDLLSLAPLHRVDPIVVVDDDGRAVGAVYARDVMRWLAGAWRESAGPVITA